MAFNSQRKRVDNISAIRISRDWNGQPLSEFDLQTLKKYAGFGGLKAVLFPPGDISEWDKLGASLTDKKLYPQVMELHSLLKDKLPTTAYKAAVDSLRASRGRALGCDSAAGESGVRPLFARADSQPAFLRRGSA